MKRNLLPVAAGTLAVLLIPLVAMQFNDDVNWNLFDFIVAAVLLFTAGTVLQLIIHRVKATTPQILLIAGLLLAFCYVWAELAVGIFFNFGS